MILACDGCGVLYLDNYKVEGDPCPLNPLVVATWPSHLELCDGHLVPLNMPVVAGSAGPRTPEEG